ncbi:MAG: isoprenyl transferase [Leptospiraceae bacterium]|nr:isoprenyl transferase [Leptospiraceae bacterium]MCP5500817.1 isoprenyl transferase [Leptospiraceae bacterium]
MSFSPDKLPGHVAIIMDGNGRWAKQRGLERKDGHREGSNAIDRLLDVSLELGLRNISLYAFSTENWRRPPSEITSIFKLLDEFVDKKLDRLIEKNVRVHHSGSRKRVPSISLKRIDTAIEKTSHNTALHLNFCLNYGSMDEICTAFNRLLDERKKKGKTLDSKVKPSDLEKHLYTYPLPPVDLLIRTAGERRLSNFLLWQSAYAELYFTETLWPDFNKENLLDALNWYSGRVRKYGGLV